MSKEILLADLRNKLSPIKNYFEMNKELSELLKDNSDSYVVKIRIEKMNELFEKEILQCEQSICKIEYIIELLEKI